MKNRGLIGLFTMSLLLIFACQNEAKEAVDKATDTVKEAVETAKETVNYTITPFADAYDFSDATMESMAFKDGKFQFGVSGEKYKLGAQTPDADIKMCANSGKGQHIHLIVDDQPYAAKYTADFDYEIPNGEHYILAFLSRSYHESIKTPQAHKAQKVMIKDNTITQSEDITAPMLFYSRPKGTYVGKKDTEKIMLDFYLVNANLGTDGYTIKASIDSGKQSFVLDKWQPYYLEGLGMGEHTVKLTLLKDGKRVDTPLNPVTRTFTMKADPAE